MTADQLRSVLDATPFQPFRVRMADGQTHFIPHRDYLSISPNGRVVMVFGPTDSFRFIDPLLVTELEIQPTTRPPAQ